MNPRSKFKDDSFYTVYGWMMTRLGLSKTKLAVYAVIYGFSRDKQGVFNGSVDYIASAVGGGRQHVSDCLSELVRMNYIIKSRRDGRICYTTRSVEEIFGADTAARTGETAIQENSITVGKDADTVSENPTLTVGKSDTTVGKSDTDDGKSLSENPTPTVGKSDTDVGKSDTDCRKIRHNNIVIGNLEDSETEKVTDVTSREGAAGDGGDRETVLPVTELSAGTDGGRPSPGTFFPTPYGAEDRPNAVSPAFDGMVSRTFRAWSAAGLPKSSNTDVAWWQREFKEAAPYIRGGNYTADEVVEGISNLAIVKGLMDSGKSYMRYLPHFPKFCSRLHEFVGDGFRVENFLSLEKTGGFVRNSDSGDHSQRFTDYDENHYF